jgi:phospholipid/cholesterol/gamma-HCH transport system substrate-binding protein
MALNQRQLLLGAFFVIVLAILGFYTLFLTEFSLFETRQELVVHFPDADGVRSGDSVLVAGIRDGRVRELAFDPGAPLERRITMTLTLDHEVVLRDGFDVFIEDATLLGGKHVYIDPGPPGGAVVDATKPLRGRVKGSALAGLGRVIDENGERLSRIIGDVETVVADAKAGKGTVGRFLRDDQLATDLAAGVASAKATFANLEAVTNDVRAGKGVLGRLVTDDDLANEVKEIADNLRTISQDFGAVTADVRAGKGTIGRLFTDETLSADLAESVKTIREVAERVSKGEGSLWRLIEDETLAKNLEAFSENLDQGTLGKLFTNEELYEKFSKIADDLAAASAALRNAEGTLGKLVMDRELYDEVQKALGILTRSLEEYREAAPVTTFTSVIFGAF